MPKKKNILVTQIASPIGRQSYQKKCLIGLGLNKINKSRLLPYNESIFGMVIKVKHLVKYEVQE
jgi:large subunit ribosomal protein L30